MGKNFENHFIEMNIYTLIFILIRISLVFNVCTVGLKTIGSKKFCNFLGVN